jgi:CelD/BcsL family acetyltransferase involved in cellulose biosynthesis
MKSFKSLSIASTMDEFMRLRAGWQMLLGSINYPVSVFQTWEWCYSWWEAFRYKHDSLAILYMRDGEEIIALAPLALRFSNQENGQSLEAILLGSGKSDYLDFLVKPEAQQPFAVAVLQTLHSMSVDCLTMTDIPVWSPFTETLVKLAKDQGLLMTEGSGEICPFSRLPASWTTYLASRSRNLREQIKRARCKEDDQKIFYSVCASKTDLSLYQVAFLNLHQQWWLLKGFEGVFSSIEAQDFFLNVSRRLFDAGQLHLSLQRTNEEYISAFLCFMFNGTFSYYLSGINPKYSKLSPGVVHMSKLVEDAISTKCYRFDMLRGTELYKFRWTDDVNCTFFYQLRI